MYRNLDNLGVDFYVIYRGIVLLFLLLISVHVFSLLDYICIADGDLITKKWRMNWYQINRLNPGTFLWLSQARTWISINICHSLFLSVQRFKARNGCSFC